MKEYISREALRDALYDADAITMSSLSIINRFPAADVREIKRGKWIRTSHRLGYGYMCSDCGCVYHRHKRKLNYCPNCGADMMEGE